MDKLTYEWRKQYWTNIIKECNTSGMNKREWFKKHNIVESTFYKWQRAIKNEPPSKLNDDEYNPFVLLEEPTSAHVVPSVSISKKDINVEIKGDISDELLFKIVRALSNA